MKRRGPLTAACLLFALPVPAADAAAPEVSLRVNTGVADGGVAYVARGQRVFVGGRVRTPLAGQQASLRVVRAGRRVARMRAAVDGRGRFAAHFTARATGLYRVRATVLAPGVLDALRARGVPVRAVAMRAGPGASGVRVRLLQRGLGGLGYVAPAPGRHSRFDPATARAVLAYRKATGMARTTFASRTLYGRVLRRRGAFRLRYPRAGRHVEFDWSRQVLVLARGGRAERVYHASSGAMVTPTVFGSYSFYRKQPGTNALGMVHSNYFIRGYAIHGYRSVPSYPASHGCIRVPIPDALAISRWIALGSRIFVYR